MKRWIGGLWLVFAAILAFAAPEQKAETGDKEVKLLSHHETIAEFQGTNYYKCMGRTALCPDKCGNSGIQAKFKIVEYIAYEKPGEYGDEKQEVFVFLMEDNMGNLKVSETVRDTIKSLEKGDQVLLSWDHNYVTENGSSSPERTITKLEKKNN